MAEAHTTERTVLSFHQITLIIHCPDLSCAARQVFSQQNQWHKKAPQTGLDHPLPFAFSHLCCAHVGPLTTRLVLDWVQGQASRATAFSWARRLEVPQPFAKHLTRLDPTTTFPRTAIFGRAHRRLVPHIYTDQEIIDLVVAARRLSPYDPLRPETYGTIFGSIAATGLRVSEALHLRCDDVDLNQGFLTIAVQ